MREAGKLVAQAHRIAKELCKPGVKTVEIDRAVEALYASQNETITSTIMSKETN